jgi:hypothetical protein
MHSPDAHRIGAILDENRALCVATVRPDGWPQATFVGYARDGLTLYFMVAADSQKRSNIRAEPRVSIAVGQTSPNHIRGLSMAAHALEVTDPPEVRRLNLIIAERYPGRTLFAPRETSSALIRATPVVISLIDHSMEPGAPEAFEVINDGHLRRLAPAPG